MGRCDGLSLVLQAAPLAVALACAPKQPANPTPLPAPVESATSATPAAAPSKPTPPPSATPPLEPPVRVIALEPNSITLDGTPFVAKNGEPFPPARRAAALSRRLFYSEHQGTESVIELTATDAVDGALFKAVYGAALERGAVTMPFVPEAVKLEPGPARTAKTPPDFALLVRRDALDVWRIERKQANSGKSDDPPSLPTVSQALRFALPTAPRPRDSRALAKLCSKLGQCNAILYLDDDATIGSLKSALALLLAAARSRPIALPFTPYAPPNTTDELASFFVKPKLPPEVIQRVVRANFAKFRGCYELGLGRNPNLAGRVVVRFVIDLEGNVLEVQDYGSDLRDPEVVHCVLESYRALKFPKPEGGTVVVVYPIELESGG